MKEIIPFFKDAVLEEHDQTTLDECRKQAVEYCIDANKCVSCGRREEILPLSHDTYRIVISNYKTKDGCWNYSGAEVYRGDNLIIKINRNYHSFWWHWVIKHPKTGHDYLLCGEDYQGYNVINLTTGINYAYLPKAAREGIGWCWIEVLDFDEQTMELDVEGCHWACQFERVTFDFSEPEKLPFPVLDRWYIDEDAEPEGEQD